jgi:hypothetical protein
MGVKASTRRTATLIESALPYFSKNTLITDLHYNRGVKPKIVPTRESKSTVWQTSSLKRLGTFEGKNGRDLAGAFQFCDNSGKG